MIAKKAFKGVVDKILEAVDNFYGHIRTQQGRLPLKTPKSHQFHVLQKFQNILLFENPR